MEPKNSILLVDDDKAIRASFKALLTPRGYEVDTAETGREAITKSIAKFYNLVIIDMKLPDMEGTELLARLDKDHPRPKKIMITGYPTLENAISSVNLRADAYLVKPVRPEEFLRVVAEKIREQTEEERMITEKVTYWVETQRRETREKQPSPNTSKT